MRRPQRGTRERRRGIYSLIWTAITWKYVEWVKSIVSIPVLLKGVLTREDTRIALNIGIDGIVVSNHGARTIDTVPAAMDALPEVVEAADSRMTILMDSGIRRGTDVLKALALGAKAVLLGRPYLYGLGINGAEGVRRVVEILQREVEMAMALTGRSKISEIDRSLLW
ncbi:MAG: alpha-hydroxy acid oxidase [Bryobacteraceae bacterium]